ncbi:ATP-dependent helicase [Candidatus Berkelbacteria bacterium CG10_big_fil_rev_8_21_14_0_10_43_13]|uniref:ATP-dependent helicase n=1 Tax=Candidatus Berkelbacteria bacterium CG10_big_fil_rev_8_21_14_0_10_43_13 TaxID=1974514 RepID=A0A2H0W909_9BACT|nr:MAG: ATP-dependent helicase [Candidatus Berkelbacteria bacterium CG10_big_fil_rev_8_21_14_0_10_43_13]
MQTFKRASSRSFGSRSQSPDRGFVKNRTPKTSFNGRRKSFSSNQSAGRGPKRRRGETIDIARFIHSSSPENQPKTDPIVNSFDDFNLAPEIKSNLKFKKYVTPTPIQDQAINLIVEGRDLIGLASTGTGKTGAFLLPLIDKVVKDRSQRVLILAPTRELALQIDNEFRQFAWNMQIFSAVCVGGAPIHKQIHNLTRKPNFVIGTPGRLKDLSERKIIDFSIFNNIVLDEVDRMLDMGFIDEIKRIMAVLPTERQTLFFSATMPDKIRDLVAKFLNNPVTININSGTTAGNVEQDVIRVHGDKTIKFNQLSELLKKPEMKKVLLFSETKRDVERLTSELNREGFKAESIHGNKKQNQRVRALTAFRNNEVTILVATDVAARGLDIKDITHVINYTVPQTYDDYIHRIGRTGRGDKKGIALTFVEARN